MELLRMLAVSLALRPLGAVAAHGSMALLFVVGWVDPDLIGPGARDDLMRLFFMEFLVVHSTVLLTALRREPVAVVMLLLVYGFFGWAIGSGMSTAWVVPFFLWHLVSLVWCDLEAVGTTFWWRYGGTVLAILVAAFLAVLLPWPGLGWTDPVIPAIGTVYFTARTALEAWIQAGVRNGSLDRLTARLKAT